MKAPIFLISAASFAVSILLTSQALRTEPSPWRVELANRAGNYALLGMCSMALGGVVGAATRRSS